MSAWVEGKLDLKCSLDVLKKAIIGIQPQWEDHLLTDPEGNIPMYRYNKERSYNGQGGNQTVHLLIPGSGHPNVPTPPLRQSHNDWGFRRTEDGKWEVIFADFGLDEAKKLETQIKSEVALMKAKAIAKIRGFEVLSQMENNEEKYIDIRIDTSTYQSIIS